MGVARLSKFDARVSTRFSLLSIRASSSSLTLAQTFEAGFFFPRLNITSLAWGQPGKSPSYPTPSLKSAKSVLWTPIFTLLRSKRKAMRGLQLARVLSGHRVYGGAQQSLRAHRRRNVERNSFAQVQVKRSLVFRLLARHKGNFLRTLRRKLRFGVGNKPNVLKRIVRSQGGLKKKHHGA